MKEFSAKRFSVVQGILTDPDFTADSISPSIDPAIASSLVFPTIPAAQLFLMCTKEGFSLGVSFSFEPSNMVFTFIQNNGDHFPDLHFCFTKYLLFSYVFVLIHRASHTNESLLTSLLLLISDFAPPPSHRDQLIFAFVDLLRIALESISEAGIAVIFPQVCDFFLCTPDIPAFAFSVIPHLLKSVLKSSPFSGTSLSGQFCSLVSLLISKALVPPLTCVKLYRILCPVFLDLNELALGLLFHLSKTIDSRHLEHFFSNVPFHIDSLLEQGPPVIVRPPFVDFATVALAASPESIFRFSNDLPTVDTRDGSSAAQFEVLPIPTLNPGLHDKADLVARIGLFSPSLLLVFLSASAKMVDLREESDWYSACWNVS
jgi:hypothetical protein